MGKNFKRIYQNCENGVYCIEEVANNFSDMYCFKETEFVYDKDTKFVFHMPTASSVPILYKSKNGKHYKFNSNLMIEVDK